MAVEDILRQCEVFTRTIMSQEEIIISNVNEAFIKVRCSEGIAYELREAFTFFVPGYQFTPKFKARLWDGKIRLFDLKTNTIYRGLTEQVKKFCSERGYPYTYDDEVYDNEFSLSEAVRFIESLNLKYEPRDYQLDAFVHAIRNRRALLLSPTGSGKSLIIYLIMRYLLDELSFRKFLIIVPTISLVNQLASDFADYGFDVDSRCHRIFSGEDKHTNKEVTISTWQSLHRMPKEYFRQFDAVIGDEAHLFKAQSLTEILTSCIHTKYRIGTTGTLDGTKTHKLVLEGLFGPVKKVTTTKELMDQKHLADFTIKSLLLKHPDSVCQAAKSFTYQQEIEYLVLNESRNKFIRNLALSLNGNTLILYQYVEKHGKILHDIISKKVDPERKVFFVSGETDSDFREEVRHMVEKETNAIIVASFGVFSTGVNIKNLNNIIFASPSKSRIRNLQSIGRGLRKSETKTSAVLFDIADDLKWKKHENFTIKHFQERLRIYSEEKFKFKIYKIELKG